MQENETIAIVFSGLFTLIGWVTWVVATNVRRSKVARARVEMQSKLVEKFASSPELLAYLQTDAGKTFLESSPLEKSDPFSRILGAIRAGVILSMLGAALLVLQLWARQLLFVGVPVFAVGAGFLVAAGISYKLSRQWGLFDHVPGSK